MDNGEVKIKEFLEARSQLLLEIKKELAGPDEEPDILIENPVRRYSVGMLFPVHYESRSSSASEKDADPEQARDAVAADEESEGLSEEAGVSRSGSFYPSAMGLSFYCLGTDPLLKVVVQWATYRRLEPDENYLEIESIPEALTANEEFKSNFIYREGRLYLAEKFERSSIKTMSLSDQAFEDKLYRLDKQSTDGWKRQLHSAEIFIDKNFFSQKLTEGMSLSCQRKYPAGESATLFTVALNNTHPPVSGGSGMGEERIFFKVSIHVESGNKERGIFTNYLSHVAAADDEEQTLDLLYRRRQTYAIGHGCAANWEKLEEGTVTSVYTEMIPSYEVPQADFDVNGINEDALRMNVLSGASGLSEGQIISLLEGFVGAYKTWIESIENDKQSIPPNLAAAARRNILLCKEAADRMLGGIKALGTDPLVMKSFKLANKAMMIQSFHSAMQKTKRMHGDDPAPQWPDYSGDSSKKWRPFQLAFILLSIVGIIEPSSTDRGIVDLIWFPTGGGKTEAYLGLSAFTIIYRRLRFGEGGAGTSIIMRYTLRLLTTQQFQRACTLICALESMRKQESLGDEEISIGLWVGNETTANTIKDAKERFNSFLESGYGRSPGPTLSCPWCGTRMIKIEGDGKKRYAWKEKRGRASIYCFEESCPFHGRLPILFVDEEIYNFPPTLLFGTVDKFAQMPRESGVSEIFATEKTNPKRSPELIIQDELHLISGALGTIVGLYETVIDYFCAAKGVTPKIIASTATVRRAAEQCRNLFNRDMRQFPPPGIDIEDSFFSREASLASKPGRLYVGVMPSGKTQTTAAVRLAACLLRAVSTLSATDFVKDKYWTLVNYFNSIRELGGFISLSHDDIPLYANILRQRYGGRMRYVKPVELTSRKKAEEILPILEQLEVEYPGHKAIDILAATNMISVGVDIDRLGLMVVRGQPKLTSEYIQVSSRIGRKYPGLIATLYNSARTRDRAHYERFISYHQSFYRYVEPSSVTPFSAPARSRALKAVLIALARHGTGIPSLIGEKGAGNFVPDMAELDRIIKWISGRVGEIDPKEKEATVLEVKQFFQEWGEFAKANEGKVVYKNSKQGLPLIGSPMAADNGRWPLPTSMRNVDADCSINIIEDNA